MRTSRCILYTAIATVLCLVYVFQQTEIVKMGYKITEAQKILQEGVDQRTSLEYIISSLESPLNIDKNLFLHRDSFEMAANYMLVKVGHPKTTAGAVMVAQVPRNSMLKRLAWSSLFASKQAEARTIK